MEDQRLKVKDLGIASWSRETAKILSQNMYKMCLSKAGQRKRVQEHLAGKGWRGKKRIRMLQHSGSQTRKTFNKTVLNIMSF